MGYGTLTPEQRKVVQKAVKGQVVHDLGAGDLALTHELLQMGAAHVVAIDKEAPRNWKGDPRIQVVRGYFRVYTGKIDIAFVSWPSNYLDESVVRLMGLAGTVIYLGTNTGGTACGSTLMFEHLLTRELLAHVPNRANTLLVYGEPTTTPRKPVGEELAALTANDRMWMYEESYPETRRFK